MSYLAEGPSKKGLFSKALTYLGKNGEQEMHAPSPMPAEPTYARTVLPTGPARGLHAQGAVVARYPEAASPFSSAYGEVEAMESGAGQGYDVGEPLEAPMSMTELADDNIIEAMDFIADNLRRDNAEKASAAEATLAALKFTLDARGLRVRQLKGATSELGAKNLQLDAQVQDLDLKYRAAVADAQHFQEEFRGADQRAKALTSDVQETSQALASVQDTVRSLSSRCQELERDLHVARTTEEQQRLAAADALAANSRLEQQVAVLTAQVAGLRADAAGQDAALRRYQLTAESLRALVDELPVASTLAKGVQEMISPAAVSTVAATAPAVGGEAAESVMVVAATTDGRTPTLTN